MAGSPVVLRIKLRYDDIDTMVLKFAPNVGKSGLFVPTKSMQPVGTEVKFELRLFNDTPVLVGLGRVKYTRPPDPANPKAPYGIAIELMRVSREGRELIIRMLERRKALGLPEVSIPQPEDERREESQPRADTSGIVRDAMAQFASAPVADQMLTATMRSEPIAVAVPLDPVSRPIAAPSPVAAVAPLAPEPARARRPAVAELIAKASESGPVEAAVEGFEDAKIDLAKVLARARALAAMSGGDELDAELAKLQEENAAPNEISIEAASAELAKQLGGVAVVHRDRSASTAWAPPPAVVVPKSEPVVVKPQAVIEPEPEPEILAPEPAATELDHDEPEQFVAPDALATQPNADDDAEELDSADLEEEEGDEAEYDAAGEHTQIGGSPLDPELADRLDAHLAQAEAEADAEFSGFSQPPGQFVDGEYFPQPGADSDGVPQTEAAEDAEEIDDLDVLAEANADDADLLSADGERDSHDGAPAYRDPERPSQEDFAARLDLDEPDPNEFEERHDHYRHTPSARPGTYDPPSGGYTVAEPSYGDQGLDFDEPHAYGQHLPSHHAAVAPEQDPDLESALEQLDMDLPDVRATAAREGSRPVSLPGLPVHRPQTPPLGTPTPGTVLGVQSNPKQPAKPRLPTEDDGILIDFDDDE